MLFTDNMNQLATYWAPSTNDEFGTPVLSAGELIMCRWQDVADVYRDDRGREFTSQAIVYVGSEVARRGFLALGDHASEDPRSTDGAFEVRQLTQSPSLDADVTLWKAVL